MNLEAISKNIETMPSILTISQMQELISQVMNEDIHELGKHKDLFFKILDILAESQNAGTYFEVTPEKSIFFRDFSNWLKSLPEKNSDFKPDLKNLLAISKIFLMFPWEIYG